ncbi:DNA (cytosine-5-)-methyltransferase [Mesoplasma coleopterae]|nr:DNA (cytosine-5-)-methyltransferase [Mesoplasma coleopterae]
MTGEELVEKAGRIDLITYSFPCQDLSMAGSFHGFNQGMAKGSGTRSGLLWEIERILTELDRIEQKPKYLLLENVKNMISDKHLPDYKMWLKRLNELGYNTQTFLLKSNDYGSPQIRQRVYAISILRNCSKNFIDTFNTTGKIISEIKIVDKSKEYKISKEMFDIIQLDEQNNKILIESIESTPNKTPSRLKMFNENPKLFSLKNLDQNYLKNKNGYFLPNSRTITTKQDRHPNAGVIDLRETNFDPIKLGLTGKARYRFLTTRETYMLMGFDSKDFNKVIKHGVMQKEILYRQAGNSIVVNVLVALFEYMNSF